MAAVAAGATRAAAVAAVKAEAACNSAIAAAAACALAAAGTAAASPAPRASSFYVTVATGHTHMEVEDARDGNTHSLRVGSEEFMDPLEVSLSNTAMATPPSTTSMYLL